MLPAPPTPTELATLASQTLEERVGRALKFLTTGLQRHGFRLVAGVSGGVENNRFLLLEGHGIILDCALVDGGSVIGIQNRTTQKLSQATNTDMALRILVTEGRLGGSSQIQHVPLSLDLNVEREVVYNVLKAVSATTKQPCDGELQLENFVASSASALSG